MFVRVKKIGAYEYLYLVENAREGGRHVQRVIKALGRRDKVEASGLIDGLIASADSGRAGIARLVEQLFQIVDIVSDDCEDAGEKLDGNDPVLRLPVLTFVPEIAVLLPQGFGLSVGRRHLSIGRAPRASEDEVARRQRQQSRRI